MNNVTSSALGYIFFFVAAALAVPASGCSGGSTSTGSGSGSGSDAGTASSAATLCEPEGSWSVQFQWSGRTPGELTIEVAADKTAKIPAGDGVGATTGTWSTSDDTITWSFADGSTFYGSATASCSIGTGHMKNTAGKLGSFTASKGGAAGSGGSEACTGCTADSDCGSCERCQRTTCSCIARLTCP